METARPASLTGFVILLLGILTLNPEICVSVLMVMIVSSSMQFKALELERAENHIIPSNTTNEPASAEAYYSW